MSHLVDTSLLLRLANIDDPLEPIAVNAIGTLHRQNEVLQIAPQNLIEFRGSATRPIEVNGLGLTSVEADIKAAGFETAFPLLQEISDIYPAWKALVQAAGVTGKQVHDACLVAICQVYGITHILTFNVRHFTRLVSFAPGISVVAPNSI